MSTALVLAGNRGGIDPVAAYAGATDKALIEIDGQTMLAHVVAALRAAGMTRILVSTASAPVIAHARDLGVEPIAAGPGPSASARIAFVAAGAPLLVTTGDHPLLRAEWIEAFLRDVPASTDVAALLARRESIERDAPPTRRTYLRFADGDWSGCNLFLLATPKAVAALDLWERVERDRKRPWRLALVPLLPMLALAKSIGLFDRDRLKALMHRTMLG
ncbi:MAG: GTP--adenosylcobinamide-phosphate guanylyltransferase, partial [Sphingomonas sp.]